MDFKVTKPKRIRPILVLAGFIAAGLCRADASDCAPVQMTTPPNSLTVQAGCPADLTVTATGTPPLEYQWFRNDVLIPGATNPTHTVSLSFAESPAEFRVRVGNPCSGVTSEPILILVSQDVSPPRLQSVRGTETLQQVVVSFVTSGCGSYGLNPVTAQDPSNYLVSGGVEVHAARLEADGRTVLLSTTRQTPGAVYTLQVTGIRDVFDNAMWPALSNTEFQAWVLVPGTNTAAVPPPLAIDRSGPDFVINWPPGSLLESSDQITGPWNWVYLPGGLNPARPYVVSATNRTLFFRARFSP